MFGQKRWLLLAATAFNLMLLAGWSGSAEGRIGQKANAGRPAALTPLLQLAQASDEINFNPSPDGQWTAVVNQTAGSLDLQQSDGQTVSVFPPGSTVHSVTWSPDSRHLLVVRTNWVFNQPPGSGVSSNGPIEIWQVEIEDGRANDPTRIFQSETISGGEGAEQIVFGHWSPDSRHVLFWHGPLSASILADGLPLSILDVTSSQVTELAEVTLLNPRYQSWAPDSSALVFTAGGYRSAQIEKSLALYDAGSGQVTTLIDTDEQVPGIVAWSPQGDRIAYTAVPAVETGEEWADLMTFDNPAIAGRRIYLLNPATGESWRLNDADAFQDAPIWSEDGSALYYAQRQDDQLQVMAADPATGEAQPVAGAVMPLPEMAGYYGQSDLDRLLVLRPGGELSQAPGGQAEPTPAVIPPSKADLELIRFIFEQHPPELGTLTEAFLQKVERGEYADFTVQEADLTGDGELEILVSGQADVFHLFVAILKRTAGDLEELFYVANNQGKYIGQVRATIEEGRVIADFLTASGGTGYLEATWQQHWIECEAEECQQVWVGPRLQASRSATWMIDRQYAVTELEQPNINTIRLTTRRFGLAVPMNIEAGAPPPEAARRTVGPDSVVFYQRDGHGQIYQPAERDQTTAGLVISREFDLQTRETNNLVYELVSQSFFGADGTFDSEGYDQMQADVWDLPTANQPEDTIWGSGSRQADIAVHNGQPSELGEWVAGVIGSLDKTLCRLVVQRQTAGDLSVVGRANLPCTTNFTHLAWVDVTGDGNDELLLATIPPGDEAGGRFERVHIFSLEADQLVELAVLDGVINGQDGDGIRWQKTEEGFIVETGLPLIDLDASPSLETIRLERAFQSYTWNAESESFQPAEP